MKNGKKMSLAFWIFIGLIVGILAGWILIYVNIGGVPGTVIATKYIQPFGTIFLNLLKFVVVPIVLFSIACGVISMKDIGKVGSVGAKTVIYYMITTVFAIAMALILASIVRGLDLFSVVVDMQATEGYVAPSPTSAMDTIVSIFPSNIITPMSSAAMLQVIVISLFIGFGILLAGEKGLVAGNVVESFNEVFMKIMDIIIRISPIGVACLICPVIAQSGLSILGNLVIVLAVAYIGYILHAVIVYSLTVSTLGGMSPLKFFKGMVPAIIMAFSSSSSVGTLPVNMKCVEELGGDKSISSFVLPLGATINMDGTAIYQGVCVVFIAACYNIDLSFGDMVTVILTATLASIGTAGVPGAGMIMLAMVLESVGLPLEGIALVAGIDRIFDMGRTTVNITGDAACALIVSKLEARKEARRRAKA